MSKPVGFYKKKNKRGEMTTRPITEPHGQPYREPDMVVHKIEYPETIWDKADREAKEKEKQRAIEAEKEAAKKEKLDEIRKLGKECRSNDPVEAAAAKAEFKRKHPEEFVHFNIELEKDVKKRVEAYARTVGDRERRKAEAEEEKIRREEEAKAKEEAEKQPAAVVTIEEGAEEEEEIPAKKGTSGARDVCIHCGKKLPASEGARYRHLCDEHPNLSNKTVEENFEYEEE
jgi:hypothetical protein